MVPDPISLADAACPSHDPDVLPPSFPPLLRPLPIRAALFALALSTTSSACTNGLPSGPSLSREREVPLRLGQHVPDTPEVTASGALARPIVRGTAGFHELVRCGDPHIIFKDEEKTGADRMMTPRLEIHLERLSRLVRKRWKGVDLRVTEAWDENHEHGPHSLHYAGRAADLTTSDLDAGKLGMLARLAVDAGFDWVFYEDDSHVHASVRR